VSDTGPRPALQIRGHSGGVADAVRAALARSDREAYQRHPEQVDTFWAEAEAWTEE
jgi:hypothetical protein